MQYRLTHSTAYSYTQPVSLCRNIVMLTPAHTSRVECHSHDIEVRPKPGYSQVRSDYYGNTVHTFAIEENHSNLSVVAKSHVTVIDLPAPGFTEAAPWESLVRSITSREDPNWLDACQFQFASPRIRPNPVFRAFGAESFTTGRSALEAAVDLASRIHSSFKYDSNATTVETPPLEALRLKTGVCQDFAHVAIASLRSLGMPARYVSGYLRTIPAPGKARLVGADESHAWFSVYCGSDIGWVDIDPTNDCLCGTDHIPIAFGRDYSDVVPIRGVFLGGGKHRLKVSVDVEPIDAA